MVANLGFLGLSLGLGNGRPPASKAQGNFAQCKGEGQGQSLASGSPLAFSQWAPKLLTLVDGCQLRVSKVSIRISDCPSDCRQSARKLCTDWDEGAGQGFTSYWRAKCSLFSLDHPPTREQCATNLCPDRGKDQGQGLAAHWRDGSPYRISRHIRTYILWWFSL